jgi:hypothetical protein
VLSVVFLFLPAYKIFPSILVIPFILHSRDSSGSRNPSRRAPLKTLSRSQTE